MMTLTNGKVKSVILQSVLTIVCSAVAADDFFSSILQADIRPRDAIVFLGDSLKLWCQLNDNGLPTLSSSNLHFKIYTQNDILEEPITSVNRTHGYSWINATEQIGGRNTFSCMSNGSLLSSTFVTVERAIQNVTNISAVWDYSEQQIHIHWDLGQQYFYSNGLEVITDWNPHSPPNLWGHSCSASGVDYCTIGNYLYQSIIFVRVTVKFRNEEFFHEAQAYTTSGGEPHIVLQTTTVFKVIPMYNVRPGKPQGLTLAVQDGRCVTVSWLLPPYFQDFLADATYTLHAACEGSPFHLNISSTVSARDRRESTAIRRVIQYNSQDCDQYRVCVRLKPAMNGHWSGMACEEVNLNNGSI